MNALALKKGASRHSAYDLRDPFHGPEETHTLAVLVDNEAGVLARVIGLFSGRGYNIDSLTVSETEHEAHLSRITIVTKGTPMVIEQIKNQLERLVPIHSVTDLTLSAHPLERELAMIKVAGRGEKRVEALRLAEAFRAQVIDASTEHFIFEITGKLSKIEQFIALMQPLGLVEVSRTGLAAISATRDGFTLEPENATRVVVLAPPVDDPHAGVLALLADGEAWASSALALALGTSPRTVQRALDQLAQAGKVQSFGRGRSLRWIAPPVPGFPTALLLPGPLPGD